MEEKSSFLKHLLNTKEAAIYCGLAPSTLETLRTIGGGPVYFKLGRAVRYERTQLDAWYSSKAKRNTSDQNEDGSIYLFAQGYNKALNEKGEKNVN